MLVLGIVILFSSLATGGEEDVLQALERVKAGMEDEVSHKKVAELLMMENYDKLIKHTQEALPRPSGYGNAALDYARESLEK